jgi:riboflavin synthase
MFTGLIEEVGKVSAVSDANGTRRIVIAAPRTAGELRDGDSVSVSGVCLTALDVTDRTFSADLAAETLARTSLSSIAAGAAVNLELAMAGDSGRRFGGHVVQGHVDGMGHLVGLTKIHGREDYWLSVTVPKELAKYVVEKGSITIEGISLTVASVEGVKVKVAIIPHTYAETNLRRLKVGDPVNIEVDVMAKYVEKMLEDRTASSHVTLERLEREGF